MSAHHPAVEQAERLYAQGQFQEVVDVVVQATMDDPRDGALWRLRGRASFRLGNFAAAATALDNADALISLDAHDRCLLGRAHLHSGNKEAARTIFDSLAESPDCPGDVLGSVAAALGHSGDADAALEVCRAAALREPARAEPLVGMTYYLRKLGYPPKVAVPLMTKAVSLAPGNPLYVTLLAFLLADDGNAESAYDLICDLQPEQVQCACQLRRMMTIFQQAADHERWSACRNELSQRRKDA